MGHSSEAAPGGACECRSVRSALSAEVERYGSFLQVAAKSAGWPEHRRGLVFLLLAADAHCAALGNIYNAPHLLNIQPPQFCGGFHYDQSWTKRDESMVRRRYGDCATDCPKR
jgi:hypothetical protein